MDTGNTAYVLGCAALVMFMTPGLALFYGGMVRARSVLNMMMMMSVGVRDVPADVRGDHRGAAVRCGRRTRPVLAVDAVHRPVDGVRLRPARALDLRLRRLRRRGGRLDGQHPRRPRLRGRYRRRDQLRGVGARARPGARSASRLAARPDAPAQPALRPARRRTAVVRLVRVQRRVGAGRGRRRRQRLRHDVDGIGRRGHVLARAGAPPQWASDQPRRRSAAIAGLVGITPACGFVDSYGALAIGLLAGVVCQIAIRLKYRLDYDDSLDVVAIHGVGGLVGMLMLGFVATSAVNEAGADGLLYGGGFAQLGKQSVAVLATAAFAFTVTFALAWLVRATIGFRVDAEVEADGIDESEHAETAYDYTPLSTTSRGGLSARATEQEPTR